jgi:hypothetical protein
MKNFLITLLALSAFGPTVAGAAEAAKNPDTIEFKIKKRIPHYCDNHGCGASQLVAQEMRKKLVSLCATIEGENGADELQKLRLKVTKARFKDVYDNPEFEGHGAYVNAVDVDLVATCGPVTN